MVKYKYTLPVIGVLIIIGAWGLVAAFMTGKEEKKGSETVEKQAIEEVVESETVEEEVTSSGANQEENTLGLVDVEEVCPKESAEPEEKENLGTGQYLKDIDWESIKNRISAEEAEAVERYQQVLDGGEFIWIYRSDKGEEPDTYIHAQKQLTIQEMINEELGLNGIEAKDAVVDSFLFADVFQRGEENICLLFRYLGWYWLILHEEDGVVYGIDMPVRWFAGVQKDGLYYGAGGAGIQFYKRMNFVDGDYIEEDVGEVLYDEFFIEGMKQSEEKYQEWLKENVKEEAKWYTPIE